jgi:HEAT repeat protein
MDEMSIQELCGHTLDGGYEDAAPWKAVETLRLIGTRDIFDAAVEWCKSDEPLKRARGADIIAQLGKTYEHRSNSFPEDAFVVISQLLKSETVERPLASAIAALGHLDNPDAVPLIAPFATHPNDEIRFDVAFALGCFQNDPLSVATLMQMMTDSDADVRDWATFGLGVLGNVDSDEIKNALARNVHDPDTDVAEEALVGLAKRADLRALKPLLTALSSTEVSSRAIEAAEFLLREEHQDSTPDEFAVQLRSKFADQLPDQ